MKKEMIIIFIIGVLVGYTFFYYFNVKTTDEQIEYIEKRLQALDIYPTLINENTTLGQFRQWYFHYGFISKSLLQREVEKVCGTKQ